MRAGGQTKQAEKFEKAYTAIFAGVKTSEELQEMEWQDILLAGEWALKILDAQSTQDLTSPPQGLLVSHQSPLAGYVFALKRRGAAVWVNEKYRPLL
jgi:hypothetical protein